MFSGDDAKKNCPELNSHIKVTGWVRAANSYSMTKHLEQGREASVETIKKEAVEFANQNYNQYAKLGQPECP